jgi:pimeloyl-ACP methyl ester carboxylesterase
MLSAILLSLLLASAVAWAATGFIAAEAERACPPAGRFIEFPGGRLHLVDTRPDAPPDAPVAVLLHGATSHHADLHAAIGRPLTGDARVIAVDRPGHGWSDRLAGRAMADPALQADMVLAALAKLGVTRAVVVAHSLAGAMAARMALERPDLVSGLVLLGAVTHPWPGRAISWYYHPASKPVLGPAFVRLLAIPVGRVIMGSSIASVFAPQQAPGDYARTSRIGLALRPGVFEANAQDVAGMYDYVEKQAPRYGELKMPVVAIAGEADSVVWTHIHSVGITKAAANGKLITLPGVGHMPHHAVPDLITAEIRALLR